MRMVKSKFGDTIIDNNQYLLHNGIATKGFIPLKHMDEQELLVCEKMYGVNVLRKVKKDGDLGYQVYGSSDSGSKASPE